MNTPAEKRFGRAVSRNGAIRYFFIVACCMLGSSAIPFATGCGACDFAAECRAREGATQASVEPGGANRSICGAPGSVSSTFGGPNLEETSRDVAWSGQGLLCHCSIDLTTSVLSGCAAKAPVR